MIMTGLVNNILAQLAHYISRIMAQISVYGGSMTKTLYYVN